MIRPDTSLCRPVYGSVLSSPYMGSHESTRVVFFSQVGLSRFSSTTRPIFSSHASPYGSTRSTGLASFSHGGLPRDVSTGLWMLMTAGLVSGVSNLKVSTSSPSTQLPVWYLDSGAMNQVCHKASILTNTSDYLGTTLLLMNDGTCAPIAGPQCHFYFS
ncbi:hypothetical protein GOBAR_AA08059 [Gossypium barbadense]|uniref:Uncharacterized protein n=1 Tax=Gossypium barbadense TaxID=3634 RepID=A0A2P5YAE7_GOSBA|nr:hypothetical protein GOBAR_AA08059 [Gossypium barbadense]